jgi:hypothetical protein
MIPAYWNLLINGLPVSARNNASHSRHWCFYRAELFQWK